MTDNTTGVVATLDSSDSEYIAKISTLLGPKYLLPKAGVIRPGIMVLKAGCTPQDEKVYKDMTAKGAPWDDINKALGVDGKLKSKMTPANVDYFTVNAGDCLFPENAAIIKKLYADKDGKVRRIPVWFPVNEWWKIMPHSLRCWGQSGIKFMSDIKITGNMVENICRFPMNSEPGKRIFGGRQWGTRPCSPEDCREYQAGECKFGGMVQFYIPGAKGVGIWVLPTTSWYSLVAIKSVLQDVSRITGGRLARLFDSDRKPVFQLTKTEEIVSAIDTKTGKPTQRKQYLIYLDLTVDMTELALIYESRNLTIRGIKAAAMLTKPVITDSTYENEVSAETVVETAVEPIKPAIEEIPEKAAALPEAEAPKAEIPNAEAVVAAAPEKETNQETAATPAQTEAENPDQNKITTIVKECAGIKAKIAADTYQGIRKRYPGSWKGWTFTQAQDFHKEMLDALKNAGNGNGNNGNKDVMDDLIQKIKEFAGSYGVPASVQETAINNETISEEVATNWLNRLEQGDFSMFLDAIK
ncbi:MAG: hypothetical protein Q7J27_10960 [Syntrophales bacterium]|nr:hypothetical protein [Syntrophales bacterium]